MKYTAEQKRAIYEKDQNIILSAQAGAGKTQVLVQRIMDKMLEERVSLDQMLIVTFTNKAAAEMKERIKGAIFDLLQEEKGDRKYLLEQSKLLTHANIQTMHAFCIEVLQEFFEAVSINPKFRIVSQQNRDVLQVQALEDTFYEIYETENQTYLDFFRTYGFERRKSDTTIREYVMEFARHLESLVDPKAWIASVQERLEDPQRIHEDYANYLEEKVQSSLQEMDSYYARALSLMDGLSYVKNADAFAQMLTEERDHFAGLLTLDVYQQISGIVDYKFSRAPGFKDADQPDVERIKSLRNQAKDVAKDLSKMKCYSTEELDLQSKEVLRVFNLLASLTQDYLTRFAELKDQDEVLDFTDIEHFMLELLENEEICDILRNRYRYIFFDEYQDANRIQNEIIERIKRDDNLFFVGDIKQSIYRFRLADPTLFLDRYDQYQKEEQSLALDLTKNFRSNGQVLSFCNFIFDHLMTKDFGEIDYNQKSQRLVEGLEHDRLEEAIRLVLVEEPEEEEKDQISEIAEEALFTAKDIARRVSEGAHFRDFAVLMRSTALAADYESAFDYYHIPYFSETQTLNFDNLEIQQMVHLLRVVDNYKNDIALSSAMLSVAGGFTEEELAKIRIHTPEGPFYRAVELYEGEEEIEEKLKSFRDLLVRLRTEEEFMSLYDFGYFVAWETGFYSYLSGRDWGRQRLDNLNAFLELMESFDQRANASLFDFLQYVDTLTARTKGDLESAASLSEEDDVVRIMTTHKSKGLQFKHVYLADLQRNMNLMDLRGHLLFHREEGFGAKIVNEEELVRETTFSFERLKEQIEFEQKSEEIRILYVAMTRAEETLTLLFRKPTEKNLEKLLMRPFPSLKKSVQSPQEWILGICLRNPLIFQQFTEFYELTPPDEVFSKMDLADPGIRLLESQDTRRDLSEGGDLTLKPLPEECKEILTFSYPHKSSHLPYKMTVSELSRKNKPTSPYFKEWEPVRKAGSGSKRSKPRFLRKDKNALEQGTLLHLLFQKLPADLEVSQIDSFLEKMISMGFLEEEDLKYVDKRDLIQYLQSDLAKRISSSDTVYREESFTLKTDQFLVDGQIDLFFLEEEWVLVDFKSDLRIQPEKYKIQLSYYQKAIEEATGIPVKESLLYWIRHGVVTKG